jgi:hypothetical protein
LQQREFELRNSEAFLPQFVEYVARPPSARTHPFRPMPYLGGFASRQFHDPTGGTGAAPKPFFQTAMSTAFVQPWIFGEKHRERLSSIRLADDGYALATMALTKMASLESGRIGSAAANVVLIELVENMRALGFVVDDQTTEAFVSATWWRVEP